MNEYADFRESLKLLTLFHPLLRRERKDSRGRVRGFVHCSASSEARPRDHQAGGCSLGGVWVWVQRLSHCKTKAGLGPAAQKRRFSATLTTTHSASTPFFASPSLPKPSPLPSIHPPFALHCLPLTQLPSKHTTSTQPCLLVNPQAERLYLDGAAIYISHPRVLLCYHSMRTDGRVDYAASS